MCHLCFWDRVFFFISCIAVFLWVIVPFSLVNLFKFFHFLCVFFVRERPKTAFSWFSLIVPVSVPLKIKQPREKKVYIFPYIGSLWRPDSYCQLNPPLKSQEGTSALVIIESPLYGHFAKCCNSEWLRILASGRIAAGCVLDSWGLKYIEKSKSSLPTAKLALCTKYLTSYFKIPFQ